jgi:MinD superfamily P-loop ATPase
MDRKEFILKSSGLIIFGALSVLGIAQKPDKETKKYRVVPQRCNGCGHCYKSCRDNALITRDGKAIIDEKKCKGCGDCIRFCRRMAIIEKNIKR